MDVLTKHRKAGNCDENIKSILDNGKSEDFGAQD